MKGVSGNDDSLFPVEKVPPEKGGVHHGGGHDNEQACMYTHLMFTGTDRIFF